VEASTQGRRDRLFILRAFSDDSVELVRASFYRFELISFRFFRFLVPHRDRG